MNKKAIDNIRKTASRLTAHHAIPTSINDDPMAVHLSRRDSSSMPGTRIVLPTPPSSVDLYDVVADIRYAAVRSKSARYAPSNQEDGGKSIDEAVTWLFEDRQRLCEFFADSQILYRLVQQHEKYIVDRENEPEPDLGMNNEIKNEDYDEAVDIVDEFTEMGLDTLDDEQRSLYDENLEIVREYEK